MISRISTFNSFLKDKNVYRENVVFWKQKIEKHAPDFMDWMSDTYLNGEEINDGNPLVAVKNGGLAIRIIQIEKNALQPQFASWIKEYRDFDLKELVVCIQPTTTIYTICEILIKMFLANRYRSYQHKMNVKYNNILNNERTLFLVSNLQSLPADSSIVQKDLKLNAEAVKKIRMVSKKLRVNDSIFRNPKISKPYNLSVGKAADINARISGVSVLSKRDALKVKMDFENLKSQVEILKNQISEKTSHNRL